MKLADKKNDWRHASKESLQMALKQLQEKLRSLRFLSASGKLKNVCEIKELKKDIARIKTILKRK